MRRILLLVEYDGTGFLGLQRQAQGRTVQGVLEEAIRGIGGRPPAVAAGRTDAGVHALAMPFHFDLEGRIPTERIPEALNRLLPEDLKTLKAREVPPQFHARRDAKSRTYLYRILLRPRPSPLERHRAWWLRRSLDLERMQKALPYLLGTQDYSAYAVREERNPIRTLTEARLEAHPTPLGLEVRLLFKGQSFLRGQVRGMVGSLVAVGEGRLDPEALPHLKGERSPLWAPPQGLYFLEAEYELPPSQR